MRITMLTTKQRKCSYHKFSGSKLKGFKSFNVRFTFFLGAWYLFFFIFLKFGFNARGVLVVYY